MILFECSNALDWANTPLAMLGINQDFVHLADSHFAVDFLAQHRMITYKMGSTAFLRMDGEYADETFDRTKFWSNCLAIRPDHPILPSLLDKFGFCALAS